MKVGDRVAIMLDDCINYPEKVIFGTVVEECVHHSYNPHNGDPTTDEYVKVLGDDGNKYKNGGGGYPHDRFLTADQWKKDLHEKIHELSLRMSKLTASFMFDGIPEKGTYGEYK